MSIPRASRISFRVFFVLIIFSDVMISAVPAGTSFFPLVLGTRSPLTVTVVADTSGESDPVFPEIFSTDQPFLHRPSNLLPEVSPFGHISWLNTLKIGSPFPLPAGIGAQALEFGLGAGVVGGVIPPPPPPVAPVFVGGGATTHVPVVPVPVPGGIVAPTAVTIT